MATAIGSFDVTLSHQGKLTRIARPMVLAA
jgi:hypothetical protein